MLCAGSALYYSVFVAFYILLILQFLL